MTELLLPWIPTLILLVVVVLMIKRSGIFEQRAHRKRVEELLERIARAVEKNKT